MSESSARLFPTIVSFCVSYVIHIINVAPVSSFHMKWDACTSDDDMQVDMLTIYVREQSRIKLRIVIFFKMCCSVTLSHSYILSCAFFQHKF